MRFDVAACGKRIKELRTAQQLTQEQLADQLKVYRKHISKIENGYSAGSIDILIDIAEFFDVSMDYLLGRSDSMEHEKKSPPSDDDGLRAWAIERVSALPDPALLRVRDFLAGLEAGQGIGAAPAAAPDPSGQSSQ